VKRIYEIRHLFGQLDDSITKLPSEKIFQTIRMEIACGLLKPRERLIENDLCKRFDTSKHNIRQTFELLDRIALIDRRPNRGVEVKSLSRNELKDLCDVCVLLQIASALRIDPSRTTELANKLETINSQYVAAIQVGSLAEAVGANDAFHIATFDYCLNKDLAALQLTYWLKASAVISHALLDEHTRSRTLETHEEIIAAIRAGDLNRFSEIAVDHIQPAVEAYDRLHVLSDPNAPGEDMGV
jgi:DNA-binding GntR family transcriptional regulator